MGVAPRVARGSQRVAIRPQLVVFFSHISKKLFYPGKCIDVFVIGVEFESLALVNFLVYFVIL